MPEVNLIHTLIAGIILGFLCAYLAISRGRSPYNWFFIGFLTGLIGLIVLYFLPSFAQEETDSEAKKIETAPLFNYYATDWFYLDSTWQQQGPVKWDNILALHSEDKIRLDSLVWCPELKEWTPLKDVLHPSASAHLTSSTE